MAVRKGGGKDICPCAHFHKLCIGGDNILYSRRRHCSAADKAVDDIHKYRHSFAWVKSRQLHLGESGNFLRELFGFLRNALR